MNDLILGLIILEPYTKGIEYPIEHEYSAIWIQLAKNPTQED